MALGRNPVDQVSPPTEGRSVAQTGMADQTPELRRHYQEDREVAVRDQIKRYEAAGLDTSHLKAQLGRKPENARGHTEASVRFDGPAHLDPRKGEYSPPTEVYAPVAETVREPEDFSAPDKRDQDQSPVPVKGAAGVDETYGGTQVLQPKDPGPEAPKRKSDPRHLPAQESPDLEAEDVEATVPPTGDAKGEGDPVPALPDQEPHRDRENEDKIALSETQLTADDGDVKGVKVVGPVAEEKGADEASKGEGAHQRQPQKAPAKKAPAKRAGSR